MVSSGIYRYVASRDELLTMLIIEAYDALGATVEDAARRRRGAQPPADRFVAAARAIRAWALANPHEYALVYGSPVPGYAAPADTIGPASRVTLALVGIVVDAHRAGLDRPARGRRRSTSRRRCGPTSTGRAPRSTSTCPTTSSSASSPRGPSCSGSSASSCSARPAT